MSDFDYQDLVGYLDTDFPDGSDQRNQCPAHIAGAKQVLVCTFENIDEACEASADELNYLDGLYNFHYQTGYYMALLVEDGLEDASPSFLMKVKNGSWVTAPYLWFDTDYYFIKGQRPRWYAAPLRILFQPTATYIDNASAAYLNMYESTDSYAQETLLIEDVCGDAVIRNTLDSDTIYELVLTEWQGNGDRTYRIKNFKNP